MPRILNDKEIVTTNLQKLELVSTLLKGKKAVVPIDYRILAKEIETGENCIVYLEELFKGFIQLEFVYDITETDFGYKSGKYNYYTNSKDPEEAISIQYLYYKKPELLWNTEIGDNHVQRYYIF